VLIWYFFGHHRTFLVCPCPMLAQLRTLPCYFGSSLSDVGSTSDTTSLFWLCLVRCWLNFGHYLALLALPCPMLARLQTRSCLFSFPLSNVEPIFKLPLFMVRFTAGGWLGGQLVYRHAVGSKSIIDKTESDQNGASVQTPSKSPSSDTGNSAIGKCVTTGCTGCPKNLNLPRFSFNNHLLQDSKK